jgi:large subunit ribosomal protein L22
MGDSAKPMLHFRPVHRHRVVSVTPSGRSGKIQSFALPERPSYLSSLLSFKYSRTQNSWLQSLQHGCSFSTAAVKTDAETTPISVYADDASSDGAASDLSQYVAIGKTPKLKPYIVRRRLARMRVYVGSEKGIRHSPWRLNLVCQLAAGLPLTDALTQLQFCNKWAAPLVQRVLQRTANLADIRDGLQPTQLEVAECFATRGTPLKRMKTMGRGRTGRMEHRHSHMRVVLREVDFKLKVYQAPTLNQKKRWLERQMVAQRDGDRARAEREEIARLERQEAEAAAKAAAKKK